MSLSESGLGRSQRYLTAPFRVLILVVNSWDWPGWWLMVDGGCWASSVMDWWPFSCCGEENSWKPIKNHNTLDVVEMLKFIIFFIGKNSGIHVYRQMEIGAKSNYFKMEVSYWFTMVIYIMKFLFCVSLWYRLKTKMLINFWK